MSDKPIIGTLNEKSVHAFLKSRFEQYSDSHEIRVGRFIADIVGENGIIEIQTGAFENLKKKLEAFLSVGRVTIVYPVVIKTTIYNVETKRKYASPKKKNKFSFLSEAYKIREFLQNENLHFVLVLLTVIENRSGKGREAVKLNRLPNEIIDEITLNSLDDWRIFTDGLPEIFSQKDFSAHSGLFGMYAWGALQTLLSLGLAAETDKKGRTKQYKIC
ncbi:MAG: hypothetical protein LBL80_01945 [Ruminococcus sp.]|jgi:hypothetical protein|nr:hypothetical protein [Ruminococcus sp.]